MADELSLLKEKVRLQQKMVELQEGLPHLYRHKFYKWQSDFINSTNTMNLITAGNQLGKSVCNLIRCIRHATDTSIWANLWDIDRLGKPDLFWYLYPDGITATIEFETKWKKYLPSDKYKDHPEYGWKAEYHDRKIYCIRFNSGVMVLFKTYEQKEANIQGNSVWEMFVDEELPESRYDELQARLVATQGSFNMVFTATLGQEMWRKAMEGRGVNELFKNAFKQQVSMYDCKAYEDGTKGVFDDARIIAFSNSLRSENEIQKRVYGKFVQDTGLIYESFTPSRNIVQPYNIDNKWTIYAGIDIGMGGKNHCSAIALLAVSSDYKRGAIFSMWKGDQYATNELDVIRQYKKMTNGLDVNGIFYDWAAKDFENMATNYGLPIIKAEKGHDIGEGVLNVLWKNQMLDIFDIPETTKLVSEINQFRIGAPKHKAKDDLIDAVRYACSKIPWDLSDIDSTKLIVIKKDKTEMQLRRGELDEEPAVFSIEDECEEWNDLY